MTEQKLNYATPLYFFSKFFDMLDEDVKFTNTGIIGIMKFAIIDKDKYMEFIFNTEDGSLIKMDCGKYD